MTPWRPTDITSSPAPVGGSGTAWATRQAVLRRQGRLLLSTERLDMAAAALGRRLAGLHRLVGEPARVPAAPRPWPLRETASIDPACADPLDAVVARALDEPLVRRAVDAATADWRAQRYRIHGDLGPWSVVVRQVAGSTSVTLLDRGSVGIGHPGWDVVCALELLGDLDTRTKERAVAQRRFLAAYEEMGGSGADQSPAWGCVRALVTARARAARGDAVGVQQRLDRARAAAGSLADRLP